VCRGDLRSGAGHLTEKTGTLRLLLLSWGMGLLCLRRGVSGGGCGSGLLGSRSLRGDCWARWCSASTAGSSLTRHDDLVWGLMFLGSCGGLGELSKFGGENGSFDGSTSKALRDNLVRAQVHRMLKYDWFRANGPQAFSCYRVES
jgi:hypothetical protein